MKVILIADEHGKTEQIDKILEKEAADIKVHLGDSLESDEWVELRFDYSVFGNNDLKHRAEHFKTTPAVAEFEIDGLKFYAFHGTGVIFPEFDVNLINNVDNNSDVYLFAHSHVKVNNEIINGKHYINPGSVGMPRDDDFGTYATFDVIDGKLINYAVNKID